MLELQIVKKTDPRLRSDMAAHYSQPGGFVGRSICYVVLYDGVYYGSIVGGSAVMHLKGRDEFFGFEKAEKASKVQLLINNVFFHVAPINCNYPIRNFTNKVLKAFRNQVVRDWESKYSIKVLGFESLVELPRSGEIYIRDGWKEVGQTVGYTCKRVADPNGVGTDNWTGRRVWDVKNLRPKRIFCRLIT